LTVFTVALLVCPACSLKMRRVDRALREYERALVLEVTPVAAWVDVDFHRLPA